MNLIVKHKFLVYLFTPGWYFNRVIGVDIDSADIQEAKLEVINRFCST